jgi:hypothetical protein
LPGTEGIEGQVKIEDLGQTGWRNLPLLILFIKDLTGERIHQDSGLGLDVKVWLCRLWKDLIWEGYKQNAQD